MKLGANSVLFGAFTMEEAFKHIKMAGYDGIEVSAIDGMSEHLVLAKWRECVPEVKRLAREYDLELLAMEQNRQNPEIMEAAMQAAVEAGIPIINTGPAEENGAAKSLQQDIDSLGALSERAEKFGITLCVKAHVGKAIHNTPTSLRILEAITSPAFGLDMDPSHIHRANENPVDALTQVISRIKHVHIRDCKGRQQGPGEPENQSNGRGDIDLLGYFRVLHKNGYTGPVNLEVIGTKAKGYSLEQCCSIAAESRGHMQACLQACGAR